MIKGPWVFDTNVLVSALLFPRSTPSLVLELAVASSRILSSQVTRAEPHSVLARSKFDRYAAPDVRLRFTQLVERASRHVSVTERVMACRGPNDDKFLEVAVNGMASAIITGDRDLLALHPFRRVDIITPALFLEQF